MTIHVIPGVLQVEWNPEARAVVDIWQNYTITAAQFREAILVKGLSYAKSHLGRAWIMDASKARGAFPAEVQKLIETEVFKAFAANGVKYFVTIKSSSVVTNMSIDRYSAIVGPAGIQLVDVPSMDKAVAWLKAHP